QGAEMTQESAIEAGRGWLGFRPDWRYLAKALLLMAVLQGLYLYPYAEGSRVARWINAYLHWQTLGAGALIGLFDAHVSVLGTEIRGRFFLRIVKSCSSLDAQALYVASVLAFPAHGSARALGVVIGVAGLTALNLARIAALYFIGAHAPASFDAIHEELF